MEERVIAQGELAAPWRTITGSLREFGAWGVSRTRAIEILRDAGLPEHAYDTPDFPVSSEQEWRILISVLKDMDGGPPDSTRIFNDIDRHAIDGFGIIGLALQSAPTLGEGLTFALHNPQLVWGLSRVILLQTDHAVIIRFEPKQPDLAGVPIHDLRMFVDYFVQLEMAAVMRLVMDVLGEEIVPVSVHLPLSQPADWDQNMVHFMARTEFESEQSEIHYPPDLLGRVPLRTNQINYGYSISIAQRVSEPLRTEVGLVEQVSRLLWASSPSLDRTAVAQQLGMSERSLARALQGHGTSFRKLSQIVQSERARNLMRMPNANTASIAYRLGYSDPAAFSRAFINWTGLSPGRWRARQAVDTAHHRITASKLPEEDQS